MMVMELGKPGRKSRDQQKLVYHSNKVHISQWSPHSDRLLASGDDDGTVCIQFFDDATFSSGLLIPIGYWPLVTTMAQFVFNFSTTPCFPVVSSFRSVIGLW